MSTCIASWVRTLTVASQASYGLAGPPAGDGFPAPANGGAYAGDAAGYQAAGYQAAGYYQTGGVCGGYAAGGGGYQAAGNAGEGYAGGGEGYASGGEGYQVDGEGGMERSNRAVADRR